MTTELTQLESAVRDLEEKMAPQMASLSKLRELSQGLPATPEPPVVKKMDTDETIRMENFLLRERMEEMAIQLESLRGEIAKRDLAKNRASFQGYLHDKHGVDASTHKISLDAQTYTLTIEEKPDLTIEEKLDLD